MYVHEYIYIYIYIYIHIYTHIYTSPLSRFHPSTAALPGLAARTAPRVRSLERALQKVSLATTECKQVYWNETMSFKQRRKQTYKIA